MALTSFLEMSIWRAKNLGIDNESDHKISDRQRSGIYIKAIDVGD